MDQLAGARGGVDIHADPAVRALSLGSPEGSNVSLIGILADVLPLAVAKMIAPTIVPIPIALLVGRHGRAKAAAFAFGWFLGPIVMGNVFFLLIAAFALPGEAASTVAYALTLALGLLCLILTFHAWRVSASLIPTGRTPDAPTWSQTVDSFSARRSFVDGALLSASGFKGNALLLGTLVAIAQAGLDIVEAELALGLFAAIGTLLIGAPAAIALSLGKRADSTLAGMRTWLDAHGQAVVLGTLLVLGVWLVGKGLSGLLR
jgi:hypothetical protein